MPDLLALQPGAGWQMRSGATGALIGVLPPADRAHSLGDADSDGRDDVLLAIAGMLQLVSPATGIPIWTSTAWPYAFVVGGDGDLDGVLDLVSIPCPMPLRS